MQKKKEFENLISKSKNIVALTGAGISTNCGIPDFRGKNGLYSRKDIPGEQLFDINFFRKDPTIFYNHIDEFMYYIEKARPSFTHEFLYNLEKCGKLKGIITQNIDGLHHKAGNKNIIDIHGNFDIFKCISCDKEYSFNENNEIKEKIYNKKVPTCEACGNPLKPSVVFFGEPVHGMEQSVTLTKTADLFICIGTSLVVYPAAQLPSEINKGCSLVIINQDQTPYDSASDLVINMEIDSFFKSIVL